MALARLSQLQKPQQQRHFETAVHLESDFLLLPLFLLHLRLEVQQGACHLNFRLPEEQPLLQASQCPKISQVEALLPHPWELQIRCCRCWQLWREAVEAGEALSDPLEDLLPFPAKPRGRWTKMCVRPSMLVFEGAVVVVAGLLLLKLLMTTTLRAPKTQNSHLDLHTALGRTSSSSSA